MSASSFLIASCICLFYISVVATQSTSPSSRAVRFDVASPAARVSRSSEADVLYADRAVLISAERAADLWRADTGFDAAWKLARADYWLGTHAPAAQRRAFLEQGIEAGRRSASLQANRPEGYFWMAANMGALAESYGLRQGIKYRGSIKEALETVLRLDPAFQYGSADRALGRWHFKVPRLFGGSRKESERHLRQSLTYNDKNVASHFFLAELFVDERRTAEARAELQKVLDAPLAPEWAPEDREFKDKARRILASLK